MKPNPITNHRLSTNFVTKFFCLLFLCAVAGLCIAARSYTAQQKLIAQGESEEVAMDKFNRIAGAQYMIRALGTGNSDEVRQLLSYQLACDILDVRSSLDSASPSLRALAEINCDRILRDEQSHPQAYLAGSPTARNLEGKIWATARSNAFILANPPTGPGGKAMTYGMAENN